MSRESVQKKLGRVRAPRVHITYDVETGGAIEKREIPFIVGVLSDLSGQPDEEPPPIQERKFVEIDRDNFNDVMAKTKPRLAFKVDNTLTDDDTRLGVELNFNKIEDFEPANVVNQVEPLRQMLELRKKLANLRSNLFGNAKLEALLQEVVHSTDALKKINDETGAAAETGEAEE